MCTPQPVHAWRWIGAEESTSFSLLSLAATSSLSRETTATIENFAPAGFQHFVQPQAWLKATLLASRTVTGFALHLQVSVPPAKSFTPGSMPLSIDGCSEMVMVVPSSGTIRLLASPGLVEFGVRIRVG